MIKISLGREEFMQGEPQLVSVALCGELVETGTVLPRALFGESDLSLVFSNGVEAMEKPEEQAMAAIVKEGFSNGRAMYLINDYFNTHAVGTYTVKAVLGTSDGQIESESITYSVTQAEGEIEKDAFGRLHHFPWANYVTNKYCGDTFDLVERWPRSCLVKYCDYYSGRFLAEQGEFNAALEKFKRVVSENKPFGLTAEAELQIALCLMNVGEKEKATEQFKKVISEYKNTPAAEDADRNV